MAEDWEKVARDAVILVGERREYGDLMCPFCRVWGGDPHDDVCPAPKVLNKKELEEYTE